MPTNAELNQLQVLLDDILEDKTANLTPDTLREGVVCLGVEGTYKGTDTTDATAKSEHILEGESAYVNGEKIEGTMPNNGELIYDPSDEEQPIPEGYTSGGAVKKTDITKLNEYKICLGLANELDTSEGYIGATATSADILLGATAYNYGEKLVGTMANNGALNYVPLDEEQEIPAGYTTGGTIAATDIEELNEYKTCLTLANSISTTQDYTDTTATANDIRKGKVAYANGERIVGTLEVGGTVNGIDPSLIRRCTGLFAGNTDLVEAPLFDLSTVNNMQQMFEGCTALQIIPEYQTTQSVSWYRIFYGCTALVTIPTLKMPINHLGYAFNGCSALKYVPVLDVSSITLATSSSNNTKEIFTGCINLTNESLNNIMMMCINMTQVNRDKTLKFIGLTQDQATRCKTLSNYQAFLNAGWTTGY